MDAHHEIVVRARQQRRVPIRSGTCNIRAFTPGQGQPVRTELRSAGTGLNRLRFP
ncbi:hypothetical protein LA5095_00575 [Roseibium album]|uniref:Uncharacterized protein n=1 Tax=Roseibium album TaxID=311410 RepID=A0A0M7AG47_9HYPH|nr:hypothetical protein LA5094_03395 [Roseibium album]CTQ65509.1 hypothetical protein LA5095_00575 [Roseibium album]CTQ73581.1 hypothetical protein LA5096_03715 [Roseibium album]